MRTMRFPVILEPDESIPGALARGIRDNVLERSSIFFDDAGARSRPVGLLQAAPMEDVERLARFMGCSTEDLAARSGNMLRQSGHATFVEFGDLRVPVGDVAFARRRVSPLSLAKNDHHRETWMFMLLPYCPESLERLIDCCPNCGVALGWRRCWGIGNCEWCRNPLAPSLEAPLPPSLAENYRFFAALLTPREQKRKACVLQLPASLHDTSTGTLITMALRLGQTCRPEPILWKRREELYRLEPQLLASVIATGTEMLRSWPRGFVEWSQSEFHRTSDDLIAFNTLKMNVRLLGNARRNDPDMAGLLQQVIPQEFGRFADCRTRATEMNPRQLRVKTGLKIRTFEKIRADLEDRRLPTAERVRSQLNPDRVKSFVERYPSSRRLNKLTFKLMVPTYALEQMVCLGVLTEEEDPIVKAARHGMCVQQEVVDGLIADIRGKVCLADVPVGAVALETAARQIGGREKPWGSMFHALRNGELDFWLADDTVTSRSIRVLPQALKPFREVVFDRGRYPAFPFARSLSKDEVEEILNIHPKNLPILIEQELISFEKAIGSICADRSAIARLARRMASSAEVGHALDKSGSRVASIVSTMGVRPIGCGWSRVDCVRLGILSPLPNDDGGDVGEVG